jgi:D-alanyl-D-alanine endopeptidase (penicillin-binding protein 7)
MVKLSPAFLVSLLIVMFGVTNAYAADDDDDAPVKHTKKPVHHVLHRGVKEASGHTASRRVTMKVRRHGGLVRASYTPAVETVGDIAGLNNVHDALDLKSGVALVLDQSNSEVLFDKNADVALPIASITKLMTALIVVEAKQDMNEILEITDEDVDREKFSSSRLRPGVRMTRGDMLHIALMSSENRAAHALGRNYPGGLAAAVAAMNAKAKEIGMTETHYVDPTGLSMQNVASARDLTKLVAVAQKQPLLCEYSTDPKYEVAVNGREMEYHSSNHLTSNPTWDILLQKTGFINEAGHCLVMRAMIEGRAVVMVFLDAKGKYSGMGDATRIRKWLEGIKLSNPIHTGVAQQG